MPGLQIFVPVPNTPNGPDKKSEEWNIRDLEQISVHL